jgi:hypothetical protein
VTPAETGSIDRIGRDAVSALTVLRNVIVSTVSAAGEIGKIDSTFPLLLPRKQTRKKWTGLDWPDT